MVRVGLVVPGVMLRRGLEEILQEFAFVAPVASTGWPPGETVLPAADVWIVSGVETDPESLLEHLPEAEALPAVLLLADDAGAALDWLGLPLRALGVLPSESSENELEAALAALHEGLSVLHPETWRLVLSRDLDSPALSTSRPADEIEPLTERELEVLQLLALGLPNKKIALDLVISEHTVKFHISSIYGKLGVGNRTEAVRMGLQTGLISL